MRGFSAMTVFFLKVGVSGALTSILAMLAIYAGVMGAAKGSYDFDTVAVVATRPNCPVTIIRSDMTSGRHQVCSVSGGTASILDAHSILLPGDDGIRVICNGRLSATLCQNAVQDYAHNPAGCMRDLVEFVQTNDSVHAGPLPTPRQIGQACDYAAGIPERDADTPLRGSHFSI